MLICHTIVTKVHEESFPEDKLVDYPAQLQS